MSEWKRRTLSGAIVSIAKDFTFNDKETGEPKRCIRFRLQTGGELRPCVAFGEVAEDVGALGVGRDIHNFEALERGGSDEIKISFVLKGKGATAPVKVDKEDIDLLHKRMISQGFKRVEIKLRDGPAYIWRPEAECRYLDGRWQHDLEICLNYSAPGVVLKAITGKDGDREKLWAIIREMADALVANRGPSLAGVGQQSATIDDFIEEDWHEEH